MCTQSTATSPNSENAGCSAAENVAHIVSSNIDSRERQQCSCDQKREPALLQRSRWHGDLPPQRSCFSFHTKKARSAGLCFLKLTP